MVNCDMGQWCLLMIPFLKWVKDQPTDQHPRGHGGGFRGCSMDCHPYPYPRDVFMPPAAGTFVLTANLQTSHKGHLVACRLPTCSV